MIACSRKTSRIVLFRFPWFIEAWTPYKNLYIYIYVAGPEILLSEIRRLGNIKLYFIILILLSPVVSAALVQTPARKRGTESSGKLTEGKKIFGISKSPGLHESFVLIIWTRAGRAQTTRATDTVAPPIPEPEARRGPFSFPYSPSPSPLIYGLRWGVVLYSQCCPSSRWFLSG